MKIEKLFLILVFFVVVVVVGFSCFFFAGKSLFVWHFFGVLVSNVNEPIVHIKVEIAENECERLKKGAVILTFFALEQKIIYSMWKLLGKYSNSSRSTFHMFAQFWATLFLGLALLLLLMLLEVAIEVTLPAATFEGGKGVANDITWNCLQQKSLCDRINKGRKNKNPHAEKKLNEKADRPIA